MATSKDTGGGFVHECFYRCDSREHGSNLTAVITKASLSDEKVAAYLKWCCVKYAQALDSYGRSLIHMAASKGRLKLLKFLLTHREVNINARDQESFYTSLHRSLFYGQLHCSVRLIQSGANLQQCDLDELTPLDHAMKDRPSILTYDANQPCEVYVWGTNTNYNLGIGHHHSRTNPELLDFFRKENISIKQALMSKFHSLFLGSNGKVWACGLGSGGRLGLGNEATTLVPKALKIGSSSSESCKAASVGIDHSILLMENGSVWSFGLNDYHQLGHSPPPEKILFPKAIKSLKGFDIVGISASKFHSVFWTKNQLFTCGLHGGQLGHLKTAENTIPSPKVVTLLQLKSAEISHVATSDGATVVVSSTGHVFLFHEYQCRKLTTKTSVFSSWFSGESVVKKVCVLGGHLDHKVHTSSLQEKGGDELKILILTDKIYLWQESCQQMTRCLLSLRRYIHITDVALNRVSLILTTRDGEAFQGEIKVKKRKNVTEDEKNLSPKSSSIKFLDKDDCHYIKLKRIPHIHRAVNASCDTKGRNFAVVQVHPKTGLLQVPLTEWREMKQNMKMLLTTASEFDTVHDVVFEVEGVKFPAHRYVVSHSCEVLEEMINRSEVVDDVCYVTINNIQPQIFERVLCYIYSGECDLLQIGICPVSFDTNVNNSKLKFFISGGGEEMTMGEDVTFRNEIINSGEISAFEYHRQQQQQQRSNKKRNESSRGGESKAKDPIRALRDAARIFELTSLAKKLENFRYENGYISKKSDQKVELEPPKFNRKHLKNLWDISIKSEDGIVINAHKCILVARLEYFNCMINHGWIESSLKTQSPISLPIPSTVLEILIGYLYTDEVPEIVDTDDADLASHVLVIADQLFCTRLKEMAEASLGNTINLKNAAEMLQLAVTYRASQLKQCAMEFICLNLPALLELRSLEILDDELLTDLRDFYRSWLPCMNGRSIASYLDAPDDEFVETIYNTEPVSLEKVEEETTTVKSNSKTGKKKSQREKKNSESSGRARNTSVGSTTSDEELFSSLDYSDTGVKEGEEETWIMVTNHSTKQQKSSQMKSTQEVGSPKGVTTGVSKTTLIPIPKQAVDVTPSKPVAMISLKTESIPIQKSTPINVSSHPNRVTRNSFNESDKDGLVLSTSSEKEFPALSASAPDRITTVISPKSPSEGFKKFVKLSQKQRKKLAIQSISENKETETKPEETVKTVWGVTKMESPTMADIMREESKASFNSQIGSLASSPPWQGPSSPSCSLSAIMAAERHQKDMITRMKTKPLEYTQMEDKAIDDLMLLYNIPNVTDERITVRRADSVFISPPVWLSTHR